MSNCKKKAKPTLMRSVLSCILSAALIVTLIPVVDFSNDNKAYAAADWENKVWIGNTPVNLDNLTGEGWDFKNGGGGYYILELKNDFKCSNATNISGSNDKAVIRIESLENVTIQLLGNATIGTAGSENNAPDGGNTYGIYAPDTNLAIECTGTLNVYSNSNAIWCKDLRVEGPTLNCSSYRTAIRVMDSSAKLDKTEKGNMLVKSGAKVTARTTRGNSISPDAFDIRGTGGGSSIDYSDKGGAAILVSGSFTVENSIVNAENTCVETPTAPASYGGYDKYFYDDSFCTTIFAGDALTVSGSDASVTGKLANEANTFGDIGSGYYFKLGAVVADKMHVKEGGTIEGFITTEHRSEVTQGLRRVQYNKGFSLTNEAISIDGEGILRNGIAASSTATEGPEYTDVGSYDVSENTSPTDQYGSHREITISKASTVYLRTTDSGPEWSFQSSFIRAYSLDSATIDFRDFSNSVFVQNGWTLDMGTPKIYVKSGDWTLLPATDRKINCSLEKGSLTVQCENGQTYEGGSANIESGATLNIQGDGISKKWEIFPLHDTDIFAGTVRFISGTVRYASAKFINKIYILGGNIYFYPLPGQVVKNGDGTTVYPRGYYFDNPDSDKVISISTPEGTIVCEDEYYYTVDSSVSSESGMVVWSVNDFDIYYATAETADGEQYRLLRVPGGKGKLQKSVPFYGLNTNPNYRFYSTPDGSVTLTAGKINVYENWVTIDDPHLIGTLTELNSNMSAEWSYQNEKGEKVVVGGSSLTCTIDDLNDIVNYRTYTCKVYVEDAGGKKEEIGSYSAKVYVMRWEQPEPIYSAPGKEVTFTANPSDETEWAADFFSTLKWQVNKGTGWEDIPDSDTDNYTVTITEENAGYKYRRVINSFLIGNFDKHESNIYVEMNSPELSVTLSPEITSQPQSIKIQENDTAKHELSVSANNAESYRWQKKVDGTFADIEGVTSSTLEVGAGDVGTYRCILSNKYGETVSEEASVGKGLAPSCGTLSGVNVTLGAKAQFGVGINNAPGDCGISVKWQYSADDGATWVDVVSIDDSKNISMNVLEMVFKEYWSDGTVISRTEISSSYMTINKTTADMDGWKVRCVLTDAVGVYYSNTVELSIDMPEYTISFDTGEHGTAPEAIRDVKHGSTISAPVPPKADGYIFSGWYTDQACSDGSKFDFSAPITQDITLYAKWTKYYPYVPPVQQPIVENDDNGTTSADLSDTTSTSGGTTTANIDKATGEEIVDKAVENKSEEVVIDATANTMTAADSTAIAQVGIPTATLEAIAEKTDADVTVKTDVAEVTIDNTAAGAVAKQAAGETVQIIVEKVDETADKVEFQLKVVCSQGNVISDFKGGNVAVTVSIPKTMASKEIVCVYIDDDGRMSKVKGQKNPDGTFTFVTGHFSTYAIMAEEEADTVIAAQQKEEILAKLDSYELVARSMTCKSPSGKNAIRIRVYDKNGLSTDFFDGIEIYRSTKSNSGYGKKPVFVTKSGKSSYYNTAIKSGTKYYYKARGFVITDGEKYYTDYSLKAIRTAE